MVLVYVLSLIAFIITMITSYLTFENLNQNLGRKFYLYEKSTHLFFSIIKVFKYLYNKNRSFLEKPSFSNFTFFQNIDELNLDIKIYSEDGKLPLKNNLFFLNAFQNLLNNLNIEDENNFLEKIKSGEINLNKIKTILELKKLLKVYFPKDYEKIIKYITLYGDKVNINTAPFLVLLSLDNRITKDEVINIIKARPISNVLNLQNYLPSDIFWKIYPYIKIKPSYFLLKINIYDLENTYNLTGKIYFQKSTPLFYYYKDSWDRKWLLEFLKE